MTAGGRSGQPEPIIQAGALLGEGPFWVAESGLLWWVDIERGLVHRTDPLRCVDTVIDLREPVGSVVPREIGGWVAGMTDGVAWFDEDDTEVRRTLIEVDDHEARMNDAACDPAGRLFAGTMTHGDRRSALYRIDADQSVSTVFTAVGISNGLDWSPDGALLYYVDTPTGQVDVADYDVTTGAVEGRRHLIDCSPFVGHPDGLTVDAEGCLWVAFWDGWGIRRFDPDGRPMESIELPVARTTSCAFGGPDLDQIFVTTASTGLTANESALQPLAGALFRVQTDCTGQPSRRFGG